MAIEVKVEEEAIPEGSNLGVLSRRAAPTLLWRSTLFHFAACWLRAPCVLTDGAWSGCLPRAPAPGEPEQRVRVVFIGAVHLWVTD